MIRLIEKRRVSVAMRVCAGIVSAVLSGSSALGAQGAQSGPGDVFIQNATIMTASRGTIERGSILLRDGKIAAVGRDLKAPTGARVIDATGKFVTPGVIDCHSHIAVDGSVNEGSLSVTSMVRIEDTIDPDDPSIWYGLSGGVTSANVLHGSANPIGGQNAVIKFRWGKTAEELLFKGAPPGIKFALGENPKRSNFQGQQGARRYPNTRMGVEDVIRDAFARARDYKAAWDAYNANVKAGRRNVIAPRRDFELEPLVEVLEGKRLVHAHCYRADEILMLLRVANEFGFKIKTLQHVLEGYKVAREIAAHGAGASTFADNWAYKVEAFDATPYNAALMYRAGVNVSLNSDDPERQRRLNTDAARAIRYGGVPEEEALRMITLNAAKQLGIDRWVGSLDVGKDADVVIWSAHPFSSYSVAETVFVDGQQYFDRSDAIRKADENRQKIKELREKEMPKPAQGAAPQKPEPPKGIDEADEMIMPRGGER